MAEITLESTVVRSSEVMSSPVDSELVMIDLEQGFYYSLDRVGTEIWARLAEPLRVADLCAQLAQEYEVDQSTCAADVLALLNDLAANRLLQRL